MIQLQGDQRKDVQDFLTDKKGGLELDAKTIKVSIRSEYRILLHGQADSHQRSTVSKSIYPNTSLPCRYVDLGKKCV